MRGFVRTWVKRSFVQKSVQQPFAKENEMTLQQKIIKACRYMDNGDPMKDVLDDDDIEEAIKMLGDVLVTLGLVPVEEE